MAESERTRPQDKAGLLANIDQSWHELQRTITRYSDDQLTGRRDAAGWSAKDHLAHVAIWERSTLELLRDGRPQHETLGVDLSLYESSEESKFTKINAILQAGSADWPLARVKSELEAVHVPLVGLIEAMTPADLALPWSAFESRARETPALIVLDGDCTEHYDDHRRWIEELIDDRS
ncbi:MAG: DinB family protein [Thermomicrobiales bacterium]